MAEYTNQILAKTPVMPGIHSPCRSALTTNNLAGLLLIEWETFMEMDFRLCFITGIIKKIKKLMINIKYYLTNIKKHIMMTSSEEINACKSEEK